MASSRKHPGIIRLLSTGHSRDAPAASAPRHSFRPAAQAKTVESAGMGYSDYGALLPSAGYHRHHFFRQGRQPLERGRLRRGDPGGRESQALLYAVGCTSRGQLYRHVYFLRMFLVKKLLILTALLGLIAVFYRIDPSQSLWIPKCPFYYWTGFQCPACGTQRAMHQLLHFHFKEAFAYNPFLFVSLPYLAVLTASEGGGRGKILSLLRDFCHDRRTVYAYLVLILAWWVGRNLVRLAG